LKFTMSMPQSLIHEFLDRKKAGEPLGTCLKEAIFQAKDTTDDFDEEESDDETPKFKLWKVDMRGLVDNEPV
jgi:hypothetical protein